MFLLKYKKIIDLRTKQEIMKYGRIPNSKNIQIGEFREMIINRKINKDDKILVYCWTGIRSGYALHLCKTYGYNNIEELQYGYKMLSSIGLAKYKYLINKK